MSLSLTMTSTGHSALASLETQMQLFLKLVTQHSNMVATSGKSLMSLTQAATKTRRSGQLQLSAGTTSLLRANEERG